jgi:hypothetical protein
MAGLRLGVNGVISGSQAYHGSMADPSSVSEAAFGIGSTMPAPTSKTVLMPSNGFGLAFWSGVVATALLIVVRKSLPN